ncbi:patatin-like phospholipase family protein [Rhizobium sp. CNPSo 3464]|uniref:patatin-like phospholipase family protein n=1 Tax=Rhizobium sp. CNPSo 3464 TaxID=3021406 RepID=UPI00254B2667|nr:patatin-like phospholipase family protein [Rhizobium sp. CNPSo 3464]MDK4740347.1 patatin-like phospholipase family protein [Rhizobium sp. CNPSo 3464]
MTLDFEAIFKRELDVINFRRQSLQNGGVEEKQAERHPPTEGAERARFHIPRHPAKLSQDHAETGKRGTVRMETGSNLTGLSFSGGGIRSAAFCLGVSQALDAITHDGEPRVFDAFDYFSTVSGGCYIGTSIVSGMMQEPYTFPFASKLDSQETPEIQHLRNYSNFLVPNGTIDYLTSVALLMRGLLVNALIVLPALLLLAVFTVACNPHSTDLGQPDIFGFPLSGGWLPFITIKGLEAFTLTINVTAVVLFLMFVSAIATSVTFQTSRLMTRERLAWILGWLVVAIAGAFLIELQPLILSGMFAYAKNGKVDIAGLEDGSIKSALQAIVHVVPALANALLPVAVVLIGAAQKLANIARSTLGEATWTATLQKYASRMALYLAALVVPLLLWVSYLYLCYWAIAPEVGPATVSPSAPVASSWLSGVFVGIMNYIPGSGRLGMVGFLYLWAALVLAFVCLFIGPNSNSLNQLYRDRLSRAFLFERVRLGSNKPSVDVDRWKFSSLKPFDAKRDHWNQGAAYSPYLLVNTTINLIGSKALNKRGRNADNFIFSPLHIGSQATRYVATKEMEDAVPSLSLATAMATSGAAASANMGNHTVRILTFSLSLLNVRLGYWLANPAKLDALRRWWNRWWSNFGTWYFANETAGRLDEKKLNVYLTDGGHIENLGIYELLRRRCKVILAVDAEADPSMTFEAFVKLQVMARIDLGIRIELPWQDIQRRSLEVTREMASNRGEPAKFRGPHAAVGIIEYGEDEKGILLYIKSSLTGDENDYVMDYKRRNPTFPHETTLDQFFSEEQFEVYRALGFHAVQHFLSGTDDFAQPSTLPAGWSDELAAALALLNVPPQMRAAFNARL